MAKQNLSTGSLLKCNYIQMLNTFSKTEKKEFEKFVRSPFHNNRQEVITFYNEIRKHIPFTNSSYITKQSIFSSLYPCKKYRDDKMRLLGSQLRRLAEEYITYKKFSANFSEKRLMLISSLRERKLDKNIEKEITALKKNIEPEKLEPNLYLTKYRLSLLIEEHSLLKGSKNVLIANSREMTDSLICFFLSNLFGELSARKINEEDRNAVYDPGLLIPFINSFDAGSFFSEIENYHGLEKIFLYAYYYSNLAQGNFKNDVLQQKLKDILFQNSEEFSREMAYNLYVMLMNINIYGANESGDARYFRKAFEIFQDMDSKNLLTGYESEFMQEEIFLNIILTSNALKEFDWAEAFLEKNINKLHPGIASNWYNYSKALIAFNRKQFTQSLKFITNVNFEKAILNVSAKRLLAMVYYEMDHTEQLLSLIDTFNHYLNNDKKIPLPVKSANAAFLRKLHTLAIIKNRSDKFGLQKLKNQLKPGSGMTKWMFEKIEELAKTL